MRVGVRRVDPKLMVTPGVNEVPARSSVKADPPTRVLLSESVDSVGTGFLTVKSMGLDAPPPGATFDTAKGRTPMDEMAVLGIRTDSCVGVMTLGIRDVEPRETITPGAKPLPAMVRAKSALSTMVLLMDSVERMGTGLSTVNVKALDVPPPGAELLTVTGMIAAARRAVSGTRTESRVGLIEVGVRVRAPMLTVLVETKLVPAISRGKDALLRRLVD